MPLPVKAESYLRGEYRWRPSDREKVVQYGFVANGTPTENYWVNLGLIEFSGAFDSLAISGLSALVAAVAMTLF